MVVMKWMLKEDHKLELPIMVIKYIIMILNIKLLFHILTMITLKEKFLSKKILMK